MLRRKPSKQLKHAFPHTMQSRHMAIKLPTSVAAMADGVNTKGYASYPGGVSGGGGGSIGGGDGADK